MKLHDYVWTTGYRYYPLERKYSTFTRVENFKKWTMTLHETSCRYAPQKGYHGYVGERGYQALAAQGFAVSHSWDVVWRGCKVCGTASVSEDEWKRLAREHVYAREMAQKASRAADRERWRVQDLRRQYDQAGQDAVNVWLAAHEAEIVAVREAAKAQWLEAHPDAAADVVPNE